MFKHSYNVLTLALFILTFSVFSCKNDNNLPPPSITPLPNDYTPRPSAGCGNIMATGLHVFTFEHDGIERTYDLVIPESYVNSSPMPLLLNLHPVTLGGPWLHNFWTAVSNFNERANQYGYFVVQPDGTGFPVAWNGGLDCCAPPESTVDDVDFIATVIETVQNQVCVDERRVVAVGMSNGAYLAYRIACEAPVMLAAIAPVVGSAVMPVRGRRGW